MTEQKNEYRPPQSLAELARAVNDIAVPCDIDHCMTEAAWLITSVHSCEVHARHVPVCTGHLRWLLFTNASLHCEETGHSWHPAVAWLVSFEPL